MNSTFMSTKLACLKEPLEHHGQRMRGVPDLTLVQVVHLAVLPDHPHVLAELAVLECPTCRQTDTQTAKQTDRQQPNRQTRKQTHTQIDT